MKIEIGVNKIFTIVCEYYGLHEVPVKGKSRKDFLVKARQMYCYLAYQYSKSSYQVIGDVINRDHATVIFAITQVRLQKEIYRSTQEDIEEITAKLLLPQCVVANVDLLQIAEYNTKIQNCLT